MINSKCLVYDRDKAFGATPTDVEFFKVTTHATGKVFSSYVFSGVPIEILKHPLYYVGIKLRGHRYLLVGAVKKVYLKNLDMKDFQEISHHDLGKQPLMDLTDLTKISSFLEN